MTTPPQEKPQGGTPWAPSQYAGMRCACGHWDAGECSRSRSPINPFEDPDEDIDLYGERCDCCCHDRDQDDDGGDAL